MAQISLYIDDALVYKLNAAARSKNCSVSKYVAAIVAERLLEDDAEELRKKELLRQLRGAVKDPSFAEPQTLPCAADMPRRYDLL